MKKTLITLILTLTMMGTASAKEMNPGRLAMGDPKAPVHILEFSSYTCTHCAHFHLTVFPKIKEKYIDTGKVYWEFQSVPGDAYALQITTIVDSLAENKRWTAITAIFANQATWMKAQPFLNSVAQLCGIKPIHCEKIIAYTPNLDRILSAIKTLDEKYKIKYTPTLIFNDKKREESVPTLEEFENHLKALS